MAKNMPFTQQPKQEKCPECGSELVMKNGGHGPFLGCSAYPECHYIKTLKPQGDGQIIKVLEGQPCQCCGADLVLRQGKFGMFIGCSNYPECEHIEQIDKPDETIIPCPQCKKGKLLQRKSRFGKIFYSCNQYPECQFVLNNKPVNGECEYCHYLLLMEKRSSQGVRLVCASKLCGKPQTKREEHE
ncbi:MULTISPECIES: topoisomerase DNA-binding C4 zinc finger domain-containing protein [Proteus]|uniref:DNA topoisomerase family protein n=1 Tax=Proteus TaxID=583 RepID=UPI0018CFC37B|nr:topoisomerase DNA-binding C4 zinc finger domain-containing protein [Proteus vulgaris]QPN90430.1 topoisomerase DNA-binding C4 zinc finger domain-containing protein [Proteus vulgaris]